MNFAIFRQHKSWSLRPQRKNFKPHPNFELFTLLSFALGVVIFISLILHITELFITEKFVLKASAATISPSYEAKILVRTGAELTMKPDETQIYRIGFKNTGTATWKNGGKNFLSAYTMDPKYRASPFADASWRKSTQPAVMTDLSVPSGAVGFFEFRLHAPNKAGIYTETFQVAAEDLLWISGGKFSIKINVTSSSQQVNVPASTTPLAIVPATAQPSADGYSASLLLRSHKETITLGPQETVNIILGFKNSGTKTWNDQRLKNTGIFIAANEPTFRHLSWLGPDEAAQISKPVKPGELGFYNFTIQAPNSRGNYHPQFSLVVDDTNVPGGQIDIPVTVTSDGPSSGEPSSIIIDQIIAEPILRIGLFKTQSPIMIMASDSYDIYDGDSKLVETVANGQLIKAVFDFNYLTTTVDSPSGTHVLGNRIRFAAKNPNTIFTIPSYSHIPGWNKSLNDNRFRGNLEIYYISGTSNLWVINELPMEHYLRGLGETSNSSPTEFQKALATAARTYAFYHFTRNTKHGGYFHVDATYDQVYLGYGNEVRTPNFTSSVEATRGVIVTYNNDIAITPYYSRSDGRTRAWDEVWGGGPKPWLVSVPAPYDAGKTMFGHGVGMSARDAAYRADAGADWQTVLKYYYTGINLNKKWN